MASGSDCRFGAPLPSYGPNYRPYYTPYFYPLPTFYAAPPVYNGITPVYVQLGQTPAYVLPQSRLYPSATDATGPYATANAYPDAAKLATPWLSEGLDVSVAKVRWLL